MADDSAEIARIVSAINSAWSSGRVNELNHYFADDIVMRGPAMQEVGRGRDEAVKGYADFLTQAVVKEFETADPHIDVFGETAVAAYAWKMTYELSGSTYTEAGHDIFVFARRDGRWLALWRTLVVA